MATEASNQIKEDLAKGLVAFQTAAFGLVLMDSTFAFNEDSHDTYADISASEHAAIAGASGYATGGELLIGYAGAADDTTDQWNITWSDQSIVSAGSGISSAGACIVHLLASPGIPALAADSIVGFIDFGTTQTVASGGTLTVANITISIT